MNETMTAEALTGALAEDAKEVCRQLEAMIGDAGGVECWKAEDMEDVVCGADVNVWTGDGYGTVAGVRVRVEANGEITYQVRRDDVYGAVNYSRSEVVAEVMQAVRYFATLVSRLENVDSLSDEDFVEYVWKPYWNAANAPKAA